MTLATSASTAGSSMDRCIAACNDCALACNRCAAACLAEGMSGMARCIALDIDCAAACAFAAGLMARGSDNVVVACGMCAARSRPMLRKSAGVGAGALATPSA